jgi:hypothetical protein
MPVSLFAKGLWMSKVKHLVSDIQEQLAIEYFNGFDDIDELCQRVADSMNVPVEFVYKIYEDMPKDD